MAFRDPWTWPPGIIFDFPTAYLEIRDKLGHRLQPSQRLGALHNIIRDWYRGERSFDDQCYWKPSFVYSLVYIQICFLQMLWSDLFGLVGGSSPWLTVNVSFDGPITTKDTMLDLTPLFDYLLGAYVGEDEFIQALASGKIPGSNEDVKEEDKTPHRASMPRTLEIDMGDKSDDGAPARQPGNDPILDSEEIIHEQDDKDTCSFT